MLLYVNRDRTDYQGRGAHFVHLFFHTAPKLWISALLLNVALRPQRPYGLLGTGHDCIIHMPVKSRPWSATFLVFCVGYFQFVSWALTCRDSARGGLIADGWMTLARFPPFFVNSLRPHEQRARHPTAARPPWEVKSSHAFSSRSAGFAITQENYQPHSASRVWNSRCLWAVIGPEWARQWVERWLT